MIYGADEEEIRAIEAILHNKIRTTREKAIYTLNDHAHHAYIELEEHGAGVQDSTLIRIIEKLEDAIRNVKCVLERRSKVQDLTGVAGLL